MIESRHHSLKQIRNLCLGIKSTEKIVLVQWDVIQEHANGDIFSLAHIQLYKLSSLKEDQIKCRLIDLTNYNKLKQTFWKSVKNETLACSPTHRRGREMVTCVLFSRLSVSSSLASSCSTWLFMNASPLWTGEKSGRADIWGYPVPWNVAHHSWPKSYY